MTNGRWRPGAALLALASAIFFGSTNGAEAQTGRLADGCPRFAFPTAAPPDKDPQADVLKGIAAMPASVLSSTLLCEEVFGVADSGIDGQQKRFQRGFDVLSWLSFLALNAPANDKPITDPVETTKIHTKWEDFFNFRQLLEVMRPGATKEKLEKEWGTPPIGGACAGKIKDGMMVIHMIEEAYNQPFKSGPLIDQNGNYALYDILMNKTMFDLIVKDDLFTREGQAKNSKPIDFAVGDVARGEIGALMLKVSWRVLDPEKDRDLAGKIHKIKALKQTPASEDGKTPATCSDPIDLGLIGFHAGHKTKGRRQWIWTTFEHVQNVPEQHEVRGFLEDRQKNPLKHAKYFFFDVNNPTLEQNRIPARPWNPAVQPFPGGFKSQISRIIPLTPETKQLNEAFTARVKGTVWENYMLVSTQWPSGFPCASLGQVDQSKQPDMTCGPVPLYLANATLETFSQGSTPIASSSCIGCHNNAMSYQRPSAQSDFTFMLEKAPCAVGPPHGPCRKPEEKR